MTKYIERIEIRLTEEEKRKVKTDAKRAYLNQTDYIRKCLGLNYDDNLEVLMMLETKREKNQ